MMKFFINPVMTSNRLRSSRLLLDKETIMDIRELIRKAFNEDLPISGGMGNSIEEAVILESAGPMNDYLSLEYRVMDLISKGRDVSWELKRQSLVDCITNLNMYQDLSRLIDNL
jgi:hypothetical protein